MLELKEEISKYKIISKKPYVSYEMKIEDTSDVYRFGEINSYELYFHVENSKKKTSFEGPCEDFDEEIRHGEIVFIPVKSIID